MLPPSSSTSFRDKLLERLAQRPAAEPVPPFLTWTESKVNLDGAPFRFAGHEFLRGIYGDTHPHQVYEKASQVAMTTKVLCESGYYCKYVFPHGVIFYMPTDTDVRDFSKTRVDAFLADNPSLRGRGLGGGAGSIVNSAHLKKIGRSFMYLRGLETTMKAKSVPADMVVFDELDEIDPRARKSALQRLSHSAFGYIRDLSIPSIPEYGIDTLFLQSDQRVWLVRCGSCNADHCLEEEFPECLQRKDGKVLRVCVKCGAVLDIDAGRWVAKRPEVKDVRGYRISQLFASWVPPADILAEFEEGKHLDVFFNERIGIPYVLAENEITRKQILALCGPFPAADSLAADVAVGIDQGKDLHVAVVGRTETGAHRILALRVFRDEEDAFRFIEGFQLACGVIDALPETRVAARFCGRYPGKFFRNFYGETPRREMVSWDEKNQVSTSERTHSLDTLYSELRTPNKWIFPAQDRDVEQAADHFSRLKRKRVEDPETGKVRYEYVRTGADHFAHALNYARIALERFRVRHVEGGAYKDVLVRNVVDPVSLRDIKERFDILFSLVPHARLPWVGVWLGVDRHGVVAVLREQEFPGVTLGAFARQVFAAEATDPRVPAWRLLPDDFSDLRPGEKELTFLERLQDVELDFEAVTLPPDLGVMKVREYLAMRTDLMPPIPGLVIFRSCPMTIEALRMHRADAAPKTDAEERLAMYHKAVAMALVTDPRLHEVRRRRR